MVFGAAVVIEREAWDGDDLHFQMRALGQTAAGTIQVREDALHVELALPWLLAKAANVILPALRKSAGLLLEKK